MRLIERQRHVPAAVLFGDYILLKALVRRAAVADKDSSTTLDRVAGEQACTGDGDEGVAWGDATVSPAVEAASIQGVHL